MTEKSGTFLVTNADEGTAVLSSVADGQIHTLSRNPGVEADDVVLGTVAAEPPLEVTWALVEVEERRSLRIEAVDEPPSSRARSLGDGLSVGELAREPSEAGELHVIAVDPGYAEAAVRDVVRDRATRVRAAKLDATRVEVLGGRGLVSVRYE